MKSTAAFWLVLISFAAGGIFGSSLNHDRRRKAEAVETPAPLLLDYSKPFTIRHGDGPTVHYRPYGVIRNGERILVDYNRPESDRAVVVRFDGGLQIAASPTTEP